MLRRTTIYLSAAAGMCCGIAFSYRILVMNARPPYYTTQDTQLFLFFVGMVVCFLVCDAARKAK